MASERKLTAQETAELALFLAKEGLAYQSGQAGHPYHAAVRYAQSLSTFRSLNAPNEAWIAFLLYHLGQLKDQPQAFPFFESAAYVQQRRRQDKDDADMLWQIAKSLAASGANLQAQHWFEQVADLYQTLGLTQSVESARREIQKFQAAHPLPQSQQPAFPPHDFEIHIEGQRKEGFRVTPDGVVNWITFSEFNRPIVLGLTGWDVVSVDL